MRQWVQAVSSLRGLSGIAFAIGLMAFAPTANAIPVDVFFRGLSIPGDPNTNFGIGASDAAMARDSFGVPILSAGSTVIQFLNGPTPAVTVTLPDPASISITPDPPTGPQNRAVSNWSIANTSGTALSGANYLIFTHTDPFSVSGQTVDYGDTNIGITIDAAQGWAIVEASDGQSNLYYYPALLLDRSVADPFDGSLLAGGSVNADIHYVVNSPLLEIGAGSGAYALPELEIGFASAIIPEPSTVLLLGIGLSALALRRGAGRIEAREDA